MPHWTPGDPEHKKAKKHLYKAITLGSGGNRIGELPGKFLKIFDPMASSFIFSFTTPQISDKIQE